MIYFVQRADGAVKVGFTRNPVQRLESLRFRHGALKVLAIVEGSIRQEKLLHQQLAAHRIKGEWFQPVDDVLAAAVEPVPQDDTIDGSEARVIVLMQPELRDELKAIGKSQGRVLMRQIEHICKEYVAKAGKASK